MRQHEIALAVHMAMHEREDHQRAFKFKSEWFGSDGLVLHVTDTMKNTTESFVIYVVKPT